MNTNKIITLRNVYGKTKEMYLQPCKQKNGLNFPFVKKVRISDGMEEMILSEKELQSPDSQYFLKETDEIYITDGTTFDLNNPLDKNKWLAIENSEFIVPSRDARDENGNLIIDGDKRRYGLAEFWVDVPGEESSKNISKRKLITKAYNYIESDSQDGIQTKTKLLGKVMRNAPYSDILEFMYLKAEKTPEVIIELYTSSDMGLKLLIIDAKERNVIRRSNGMLMYSETMLGSTDEAAILFFKNPTNQKILNSIKFETYPEMVSMIQANDDEEGNEVVTKPKGRTTK